MKVSYSYLHHPHQSHIYFSTSPPLISSSGLWKKNGAVSNRVVFEKSSIGLFNPLKTRGYRSVVVVASSSNAAFWDSWKPEKNSNPLLLSDILWPSAGAFVAMALLGKIDERLASKGVSLTIAPLGAVCAVLFATPSSPGARKYNIFMAQIGCAAIGVLAFTLFGPGWLARSVGLSAAIAFMILTRSTHPPAASLPILFIDGINMHHLNYWYTLFPGAAACILLCLIQEVVCYLKDNVKF